MTDVQISHAIGSAARVSYRAVAARVPFAATLAAAALAVAPSGQAVAQAGPVPAWLNLPSRFQLPHVREAIVYVAMIADSGPR